MGKIKNTIWELIAGKLHNELNDEDNSEFEKLMENAKNQEIFKKTQKIKTGLGEAMKLKSMDKPSSWISIQKYIQKQKYIFYTKQVLKYAAIIIFAVLIGTYFHNYLLFSNSETQYATIEVMDGQTSHLFLFDGTEVWLNSGTQFKYPSQFNTTERTVFLNGEAFFKVAKNKNLPFKVKTGKLEVEVLGTTFNVSAYKDEDSQSVVLVEGKVQINNSKGSKIAEIKPGQLAVKNSGTPLIITKTNTILYTSWKDGKVTFNGERLGDISKKLERWYNVEIHFDKESLKDYHFSGTILRNKPVDQTLMALEQLAPIKFNYEVKTNDKDVITIKEK